MEEQSPEKSDMIVAVTITSAGRPMPDTVPLLSIEIHANSEATSAHLTVQGDRELGATFALDDVIVIALGYGADVQPVFTGTIAQQTVTIGQNAPQTFSVSCTGPAPDPAETGTPAFELTYGESILEASIALDRETWVATGEALTLGTRAPSPGTMLSLAGLGGQFDTVTPIRSVQHRIAEGIWHTRLSFGPAIASPAPPTALSDAFGNAITLDENGISLSAGRGLRTALSDAFGNAITLDENGITLSTGRSLRVESVGEIAIESMRDLTLKGYTVAAKSSMASITLFTAGNLRIESAGSIAIDATLDLALNGLNVAAKASSVFSAKGTFAELSAEGQTTVKGAMVMIN